jgi:hypothetical protein
MDDFSKTAIWRYMDLAKFASLLTSRSLYFACPTELRDPYEGSVPRSHDEAVSNGLQSMFDDCLLKRAKLVALGADTQQLDDALAAFPERIASLARQVVSRFGVSCWHESEYESDAMWKLYSASGNGIAIESTVEQLRSSIGDRQDLLVDRVLYADFDHDAIVKGRRHNHLFIKRKSFEHEKEVRATILLPEQGKGVAIACDLDVLVTRVHVSPLAEKYVRDVVDALCIGNPRALNRPVLHSSLYCPPDSQLTIKTR